jgi:hypothetical protein
MTCLSLCALPKVLRAETDDQKVTALIVEQDRLFWQAYNTCDAESFRRFITEDVEFYHDKGGVTLGIDALTESFKKNLCGGSNKVRREAVPGSIKVSLLRNGKEIYGAVMSGEHLFYLTQPGRPESLDGRANFTHLWLIKNGTAKMARVLSYDHRSPQAEPKRN